MDCEWKGWEFYLLIHFYFYTRHHKKMREEMRGCCWLGACVYILVWRERRRWRFTTAPPPQRCILGPTQDGCALAEVLKKCLSGEIVGIARGFRWRRRTRSAAGLTGLPRNVAGRRSSQSVAVASRGCGRLSVWRWASSPAPSHSEEPWGEEPQIPMQARSRPTWIWRVWHTLQAVDAALQLSDQDRLRDGISHRPETESFLSPGW